VKSLGTVKLFFGIIALLIASGSLLALSNLSSSFSVQVATIDSSVRLVNPPKYNIFEKIREADKILENAHPIVGSNSYSYMEYRYGLVRPGRKYSKGAVIVEKESMVGEIIRFIRTQIKIKNKPARQVDLTIIDSTTGDLYEKRVTQRGQGILQGPGTPVSVVERPNGLTWNDFNTEFYVPPPYVVLRNKWPRDRGKNNYFVYTPYSWALADYFPELAEEGRAYTKWTVDNAFAYLRTKKVISRADPTVLVADLPLR